MQQVNIHEAKTNLSRLIDAVEHGDEVIIARHNHPVAKLVVYIQDKKPRQSGVMKGNIDMSDDFNSSLPKEMLDDFQGLLHETST